MKTQARFGLLPLLIDEFPRWLDYFIERCPFKRPGQLECHLKAIALRRKHASAAAASKDPAFVKALYETLHVRGVVATSTATGSASGNAPGHVQAHPTLTPPTTRNARMSRSSIGPLVAARRPARVRAGEPSRRDTYRRERPPPEGGEGV